MPFAASFFRRPGLGARWRWLDPICGPSMASGDITAVHLHMALAEPGQKENQREKQDDSLLREFQYG